MLVFSFLYTYINRCVIVNVQNSGISTMFSYNLLFCI